MDNSTIIIRLDTQRPFKYPASYTSFDVKKISDQAKGNYDGVAFDGRYLYLGPYAHTIMIRYDTRGSFTDDSSWINFEAGKTPGLKAGGFDGGFFDGRYVWYVPFQETDNHTNWLRYDTVKQLYDQGSWDVFDVSGTDGLQNGGDNAGAFDGRFFYTAPFCLPGSS